MSDQSTTTNNQEIDIDDLEVEILIVAKNPKPISQASAFLSRRGWPTSVMSNLAQAIELASEKKPDFVLVSLNHQHPAMPKFIELVQTTFNATVVAFVEGMDAASGQKLNRSTFTYKIMGQMSGPNLHRSLRRILSEKFNIGGADHKSGDAKRESHDHESISVTGGSERQGPQLVIQKNEGGGAHGSIHVNGGADGPSNAGESQEVLSTSKYKMGRINRRSLKDLTASQNGEQPPPTASSPSGEGSKDLAARLKDSLFGAEAQSTQGPHAPAQDSSPTLTSQTENVTDGPSVIELAVQTALERVCQPGEKISQLVGKIENVGVFPIDSPVMAGYLVLAWPNAEPRAEEAFFKLAQESLRNIFEESGIQGSVEQGFFVQIPQVGFERWTNQAAFNLRFGHRDRELAVAFFKLGGPMPKARPVDGNQMYSIGVKHISTERPVTFKAYLHLQKNNKYFLYLRNGRQLQPEQQQRLKEKNIKDFYMKSIDVENFRSFLAASHLTETVKKSSRGNGNGSNAA